MEGKGRPAQIYSARQLSDQNNLEQLTDTLLSTLFTNLMPGEETQILRNIARQMVDRCVVDKHNPTRQLYSSIRALNRMSYQAHWEAHLQNPRIMLGHCPYLALMEHHPEICQLDNYLLQELLDTPVEHSEKRVTNARGLTECVFQLKHRAT